METYSCVECESPWFNPDDNPVVWATLNSLPIGFCDCEFPNYVPEVYDKQELREVYFLATAPSSISGGNVNILLDEECLQAFQWISSQDCQFFLTGRGRRLFPLLLLVSSDLIKIGGNRES